MHHDKEATEGGGEVDSGAAGRCLDDRTLLVGECVTPADITIVAAAC